jgi:hypothetical protein
VKSTLPVLVRLVVVDVVDVECLATAGFPVVGLVGFVAALFCFAELGAFGPTEAFGAFGDVAVFVTFGDLGALGPA